MRPATIRTGTTIRITDQDVFRDAMGIEDEAPLTEADLRSAMIRLPVDPQEAGIARISVSDLRVEADRVYFELVTEMNLPHQSSRFGPRRVVGVSVSGGLRH
jgi:hypothetical protein